MSNAEAFTTLLDDGSNPNEEGGEQAGALVQGKPPSPRLEASPGAPISTSAKKLTHARGAGAAGELSPSPSR